MKLCAVFEKTIRPNHLLTALSWKSAVVLNITDSQWMADSSYFPPSSQTMGPVMERGGCNPI